jgi:hypothetical protein
LDLAHRIRIMFAVAIAIAGVAVIHAADGVAGGGPLVPDLKTLPPLDSPWLNLTQTKKRLVLHLSNRIGNHGSGPLDLYAGPVDATCQGQYEGADLEADQQIFDDTNGNRHFDPDDEPGPGQQVGCFEYHPAHNHWHYQDFAQYSLVDVKTDELVAGPSKKIGFCILDGDRAFPELPGTPDSGHYPGGGTGCGQGAPETGPSSMGLSVGYADTYTYFLPGQRLEVTGIEKGVYCLVSTANPDHGAGDTNQLIESDDTNNGRRERIRINPAVAKVIDLDRSCPAP